MSSKLVQIDGVKYDFEVIALADKFVEEFQEVGKDEAVQIFCVAMDGGKLNRHELDAFEYIKRNYSFTAEAVKTLNYLVKQAKEASQINRLTLEIKEHARARRS